MVSAIDFYFRQHFGNNKSSKHAFTAFNNLRFCQTDYASFPKATITPILNFQFMIYYLGNA